MAAGSQARFVGDQNNTFNRLMGLIGQARSANTSANAAGQTPRTTRPT
jgi:hypothetical protein